MLQPILVRPHGSGYQIIAGERRWRAAQTAGLATVPIRVKAVRDDQLLELALVENIQREELQPLEEAQAYQRLQQELGLTQEQLAARVGRERSTVANSMRLLRAPREVRTLLREGKLEAGHVRALLSLDRADQLRLAREAARQGLSVRELERRATRLKSPPKPRRAVRKDANTRAAEQRLKMALGSTVEISRVGRAGTIRIAFKDEKELNRLFELLVKGRGRA
jgi:ParB family chromosome partitioning protein